eukprot:11505-Heterococcus_DN1.PRE.2
MDVIETTHREISRERETWTLLTNELIQQIKQWHIKCAQTVARRLSAASAAAASRRRLSESFIVNTAEELSNQHIHSTTGTDNNTATAATTTAGQHSVDDGSGSGTTDTGSTTASSSHTLTAHPYARGSRSELLSRLRAQSASGEALSNDYGGKPVHIAFGTAHQQTAGATDADSVSLQQQQQQQELALYLSALPSKRSFHVPLHRFLGAVVREACICDSSSWVCTALQQLAAELSTDSGLVTSIVDAPLQVLELCSEIKCGLWRRNGLSMQEQVMNYAEVPLCKLSRDLDVVALQFGAATAAYSATLLVNHIVHRYRCFDLWLREHTVAAAATTAGDSTDSSGGSSSAAQAAAQKTGTTTSSSSDTTTAANVQDEEPTAGLLHLVATPEFHTTAAEAAQAVGAMAAVAASQHGGSKQQALSLEHQTLLAEECLTLLVHVVTELPPAPLILTNTSTSSSSSNSGTVDTSSLHAQLRREMLHKLATGPRTYSELHDACTLVGQGDTTAASTVKVKSSDVDAVLSAIAVQQARPQHVHTRTALEPGKFVLKPEVSLTVI